MPPTSASSSMPTTCDCRATARRLAQDNDSISQSAESASESLPSQQPSSSSSPSAALLLGRSLTAHWTYLSTTCPNSSHHLTAHSILRDLITALERVTKKYETHLWKMVFARTTGPGTGTNPNLVPSLYPGLVGGGLSGEVTGHIGLYQLEEDETQILVQEALRGSIEELGGVLSEIQRRVGIIREESESIGSRMCAGVGGDLDMNVGQLLGSTGIGQIPGDGGWWHGNSGDGARFDGVIQLGMGTDGASDREMDGAHETDEDESIRVSLPTDEEMGEINVRLYGCLRRLDFLETGEVGK